MLKISLKNYRWEGNLPDFLTLQIGKQRTVQQRQNSWVTDFKMAAEPLAFSTGLDLWLNCRAFGLKNQLKCS